MVCRSDGCHFERELLFCCCSLKWCPVLGKIEVPWMLYPGAVMWRPPCEEVLLVVAGSPHLPIRHNKTSEPSRARWLNNSSPLLLHTGDGATVTCVNSNPSHNTVCTPQAGTQGYTVSKKKSVLSVWIAICLVLFSQCYCVCCSRSRTQSLLISSILLSYSFRSTGPACRRVWCSMAEKSLQAISAFSRKVAVFLRRVALQLHCSRAGSLFI